MPLSPKTDTTLFLLAILMVGGGIAALYPQLTASPTSSRGPAPWSAADHLPVEGQASPLHKLPGGAVVGNGPQLLDTNPLNGLSSSSGRSGGTHAPVTWSRSPWGAVGTGRVSRASQQSTDRNRSRTQSRSGGRRWGGAGASAGQRDPGGWLGALASSSGELQQLERQAGAIGQQIRSMRATPKIVDQESRRMHADGYGAGPTASMENDDPPLPGDPIDPNPPLPPDPVPVDGGLVVLALAGGAYGMRRLRAERS
mgnify:CR=1 FL=1